MVVSHLSLGASIRTMDSLEEGQSRFMAEILRLKQVLELPPPALFLLDELLHGTNSHDRALGSEGLIRALLGRGAIGLVTTHDLSLARVADELGAVAANVHFEDRLEGGRLVFDYRMRPGVVERSNALDLMRAVEAVTGVGLDRPNITGAPYVRNTGTLQWLSPAAFDDARRDEALRKAVLALPATLQFGQWLGVLVLLVLGYWQYRTATESVRS